MSFLSSLGAALPNTSGANTSNTQGLNLGNYGPQIAQALGQYNQGQAGTQGLAQMLQGFITNPNSGPNLAATQLQAAQNSTNQAGAGAIASQRGINPALAARQIQTQTAANNMQEGNEAAQLREQQQLADQAQLGQLYGQETSGANTNQGLGIQGQTSQNSTVSNNTNAGQGLTQSQYQSNIGDTAALLGAGASAAGTLGSAAIKAAASTGGVIGYDEGGMVKSYMMADPEMRQKMILRKMAMGGKVPVRLSPGEHKIDPDGTESTVPGIAKVAGDSKKNDTVGEMVKPGTVIVPRSAAKDPKLEEEFLASLHSHMEKRYKGSRVASVLKGMRV